MKRILVLLALTASLLAAGQALAETGLTIDQTTIAFGNLKEGVVAEKTVVLTNTGGAPLTIANVTTSCSCTSTFLEKTELAPGESTPMRIVYNTFKFPGKFEKYVNIFTGADGKEDHQIVLVGYVDPIPMGVVEVEPRKIDAGDLTLGQAKTVSLTIKNVGDADMLVTKVYSKKAETVHFDGQTAGPLTVKPGASVELPLELKPTEAGKYLDYVMIDSDARNVTDKGYKVVLVGVTK